MRISKILFVFALSVFAITAFGQKYGYLNSSEIIMIHPDVKAADQKLMNFQNELIAKGEDMAKKLEANYNAYVEEANSGVLSQLQMQEKETALSQEQEAIRQYEVQIQQQILSKREELYQPILNKIQTAVEEVGKENGYTMIFDTSTGGILHAEESNDILNKVKAKLNL
jgi:outer membrane protein